jgi:hypothetical protein
VNNLHLGDVGYNFLIDHLGNIYEGKLGGDEAKGYHAGAEANRGSIGISLLGDFTSVLPTQAAQDALIRLMAEKAAFYNFDLVYGARNLNLWTNASYTVFGHRDAFNYTDGAWVASATACPGNRLYPELSALTAQAQAYKNTHFDTIKSVVSEVNNTLLYEYRADTLYVKFKLPEDVSEQQVRNLVPSFSDITNVTVQRNIAIIIVADWNNGGFAPPDGWIGDEVVQTYFPASEGTKDRIRTLLKIFMLDDNVEYATVSYKTRLSDPH